MKTFVHSLLVCALGLLPSLVYAEDIDIYMEPRGEAGSEPLVMFNIDYRSNLGSTFNLSADDRAFFVAELGEDEVPDGSWTYFTALNTALKVVFKDLSGVKVGLMLPHNNANNCAGPAGAKKNCANGGYIAMGFESVEKDDGNGAKAKFIDILEAMPSPQGSLSHSWQGKEIWFEFYRYLIGGGVYNGRNGFTSYPGGSADYSSNKNLDDETQGLTAVSWDADIMVADGANWRYVSPLDTATHCTKVFTISFTFGNSNQEDDSDSAISAAVANGGMGISMSGNQGSFESVLEFLYDVDLGSEAYFGEGNDIEGKQNVVGWFITNQTNPSRHALAAAAGTSLALGVLDDPQLLVETLRSIFQQILSVSTTFVSASVPVNVFNRSEIVDNVYIALFQADPDAKPSWPGSLKKLKIQQDGSVVRLVDQAGSDAVAADGRINFSALTFWTDGGSLPAADTANGEIDGRDGRSVDRGGAGQKIPGFISGGPGDQNADTGARQLFTEPATFTNGTATALLALDADAATAAELQAAIGAADAASALVMLQWMRGLDVDNIAVLADPDPTLARPWILGDPLHSRPLPVNYGANDGHTLANPDIRILMGSNDGYLRMFRNTAADGTELGVEVWGFMPRMVMDKMTTLRTNTPLESDTPPHPYTVDGAPVVYTDDVNGNGTIEDGDTVVAYVGLRRGGRAYYALDVSDPDVPKLLWRIQAGDTGFETLGYTFSTPQVGAVELDVDGVLTSTPVLVFAGGYDTNKDARGAGGTDDSIGNAIYVVNALTGALIWKATHDEMVDSIPSDPTAVDTSGDGYIDRIYVGDTGGSVWRADLVGDPDTDWFAYKLADVGRHYDDDSPANERRFFNAPDVVLARDGESAFDAVIIGSGDRANPLDKGYTGTIPENYMYMIKDRRTISGPLGEDEVLTVYDPSNLGDVTSNCLQSNDCPEGEVPDLTHGWRLQLVETAGEKSLSLPFAIGGTIFFTTYLPPGESEASTCGPSEGGGVLYAVALEDATSTINFDSTDDDENNPGEATSRSDRTRELRSGGIPAEVVSLPPNRILLPDLSTEAIPGSMRWRTFWYEQEQTQ